MKKKHVGKVKTKFSTSSILKSFRKTLQKSIVFCEEIYNCNSQSAQYLKNKINKDNFGKYHTKKKQKEKKSCRETLQQSIVFHEEIYSCNFQPAQY